MTLNKHQNHKNCFIFSGRFIITTYKDVEMTFKGHSRSQQWCQSIDGVLVVCSNKLTMSLWCTVIKLLSKDHYDKVVIIIPAVSLAVWQLLVDCWNETDGNGQERWCHLKQSVEICKLKTETRKCGNYQHSPFRFHTPHFAPSRRSHTSSCWLFEHHDLSKHSD